MICSVPKVGGCRQKQLQHVERMQELKRFRNERTQG